MTRCHHETHTMPLHLLWVNHAALRRSPMDI